MTEKSIDQHFAEWESETFGFGYGTGEEHVMNALVAFFASLENRRSYDYRKAEELLGPMAAWLLINALCRADILEYGTSARYGWLTGKGERLRDYIGARSGGELADILSSFEQLDFCTEQFCNCGPDGYSSQKLCFNPFWFDRHPAPSGGEDV